MNWTWFHKLGSPKWFYEISGRWLPWFAVAAALLIVTGCVWGLAFAPPDYQQGNSCRRPSSPSPATSCWPWPVPSG